MRKAMFGGVLGCGGHANFVAVRAAVVHILRHGFSQTDRRPYSPLLHQCHTDGFWHSRAGYRAGARYSVNGWDIRVVPVRGGLNALIAQSLHAGHRARRAAGVHEQF